MSVGIWQIVLILFVVLILFGAGKLPQVMDDLGKGMKAFKKSLSEEEKFDNTLGLKTKNTNSKNKDKSEKNDI